MIRKVMRVMRNVKYILFIIWAVIPMPIATDKVVFEAKVESYAEVEPYAAQEHHLSIEWLGNQNNGKFSHCSSKRPRQARNYGIIRKCEIALFKVEVDFWRFVNNRLGFLFLVFCIFIRACGIKVGLGSRRRGRDHLVGRGDKLGWRRLGA